MTLDRLFTLVGGPRALALALCLAWHALPGQAAGATSLSTQPLSPSIPAVEAAQWLDGEAIGISADRIISSEQTGIALLTATGESWASLPGSYGAIDHRLSADGLLLAAVDARTQQAALHFLPAGQRQWQAAVNVPRRAFKIDGLCLFRDEQRNDFLFLVGEEGLGEQWLVAQAEHPLAQPLLVRSLSLPPGSEHCTVDDDSARLFINEEQVGIWSYPAHAEAPLKRSIVDVRQPFGQIAKAVAGLSAVPGGLLALDPETAQLHHYQADKKGWLHQGSLALPNLVEPEGLHARAAGPGRWALLLRDDQGLHQGTLDWQTTAPAPAPRLPVLTVAAQTDPVPSLGDAADDPAIWIHPERPQDSRILGTDKRGGLMVYDLQGRSVQDLRVGRQNNVDVRTGFKLGQNLVDLAVSSNRDHNSLHAFAIDRSSGMLHELGQVATPLKEIYGLCLFKDKGGAIHAIVNDKDGSFLQYRMDGADGKLKGELVRRFSVPTQPEGCVADDRNERLFIGEEDVAVWALDARPQAPATLEKVIAVGDAVHDDIEGLALYHGKTKDYLLISSQGNDSYVIVDAAPPYRLRGVFRIGLNAQQGIDGVSETDGLEVTSVNLGGIWQQGMLVVQDGRKRMPEGRQNYKMLPWADIARAFDLE